MNERITILTPAYNRRKLLERLYHSLCVQDNKQFIWMVVDDGSQDDTRDYIETIMDESEFDIVYFYQDNAGKHVALNRGIAEATTELLYIVDSDDYLPCDAISTVLEYHAKYANNAEICGYSFLRCYEDGSVNTGLFPKDEWITSFLEARINNNLLGDKAEVFITDILKKYPFPVFEGEKFLPEDIVWMQMSRDYKMVHINKCIYISEYLEGGLTKSGREMKKKNPLGMMKRSQVYLETYGLKLSVRIKMMLLYIIYGQYVSYTYKQLIEPVNNKLLFNLLFIPGKMMAIRW